MDNRAGKFLEICIERYRDNPILFAEEVIGIELSQQQSIALDKLANGKRKIAVKSGHGVGKSCMASVAILWFLCTRPMARIIVTAPSSNQLYNTMMSEIKTWYNKSILSKLDLFRFTKDRVRINHDEYCNVWFLSAVSVANPENISGTHAENVFAYIDEAAGVETDIFVRLEGVLTTEGSYLMMCGNPSFDSGYFYEVFHNEDYSKQYDLFTFSCLDSPNVDNEWVEYMEDKYGRDSNIFKVRVLGEFASLDEETIIRRSDVNDALNRDFEPVKSDTIHIGVDLSSGSGNDFSVICIRVGNQEFERIKIKDRLAEVKRQVSSLVRDYINAYSYVVVNIDTTGLGMQVGQELEDEFDAFLNVEINQINFSNKACNQETYSNVFTEMFFTFGDKIEKIRLLDIKDSTLSIELGSRRFGFDPQNRYTAEKKKEFIKRVGHSPDEGDAVLLAFYEPQETEVNMGIVRL